MIPAAPPLDEALRGLRDAVDGLHLGLATPAQAQASRDARGLVEQVDDYLLPRLTSLDAPLLAVVGGSTGAGKSTLVNSLVGADVTTAGVLRPTTRSPVLVCAVQDLPWFEGDRVLPGLARTTGGGDAGALRVVGLPDLAPGLALLDAPDVDSVVTANRDLAAQLLAAADLWLFVTTAARYADAVPWALLRTAQERATAVAVVLDRVPPEAAREVGPDLRAMLDRADLPDARMFVVEEGPLIGGRLPLAVSAEVRRWLHGLATDREARAAVVRQTLDGALDSLGARVAGLAAEVEAQESAAAALREAGAAAYEQAATTVDDGVRSGTLLRGEVLARWQDVVGTGEWMRSLESRVGRLRDRVTAVLSGRPGPERELQGALESSVETLLRTAADDAAERTSTAWRAAPGGAALLAGRERELDRSSPGFSSAAEAQVRDWQGHMLELVREQGADKRSQARLASYGVNGVGLAAMVAVFAQTGGLTGTEIAVAGGTSAAGQRVLEAIMGDAGVRSLAAQAREDLGERTGELLAAERARFDALVDAAAPDPVAGSRLRVAAHALRAARDAG